MGGARYKFKRKDKMAKPGPNYIKHSFSETDPKVRVELRKADLKLQKELERLEKQTMTKTNIISDHQQAMKMSWRRLESQRRQDESPTSSRKTRRSGSLLSDNKKKLLFANATTVTLDTVPPAGADGDNSNSRSRTTSLSETSVDDDLRSSGSTPFLSEENRPSTTTSTYLRASPYISSPYPFRRPGESSLHSNGVSTSHGQRLTRPHPLESSSGAQKTNGGKNTALPAEKKTNFLLPPLESSQSSGTMLTATSNTIKKETLMKAKELMNIDSKSYDPMSFQQFYSASPSVSRTDLSSRIHLTSEEEEALMSEEEMKKALTKEELESFEKAKKEVNKF